LIPLEPLTRLDGNMFFDRLGYRHFGIRFCRTQDVRSSGDEEFNHGSTWCGVESGCETSVQSFDTASMFWRVLLANVNQSPGNAGFIHTTFTLLWQPLYWRSCPSLWPHLSPV
jgi:hypothetical protein